MTELIKSKCCNHKHQKQLIKNKEDEIISYDDANDVSDNSGSNYDGN